MQKVTPKSNSRLALYVVALIGVIALMWSLKQCSVSSPFDPADDRPSGGDTIDVAIEYSPLALYTYADTLGGFSYDLVRHIAAENGMILKFHPVVSLTDALKGVDSGLYDMLIADVPATTEFQAQYAQSDPVYLDRQVLVQLRDSTGMVLSQLDLAGKRVYAVANSPTATRLRNLASEIGDTIYVIEDKEYGPEQLFLSVAIGDIPLAVVNEKLARTMAPDYPDIDISTNISFTQFQSWIFSKKQAELRDSINAMIGRAKAEPYYTEICKKYGI